MSRFKCIQTNITNRIIRLVIGHFFLIVSPQMSGTVLPPMMQNEMMSQMQPTQVPLMSTHSTATIIPPPGMAAARAQTSPHMPAAFHPFVHPELLMKNPFLPYDLANMRAMPNGRPMQPLSGDIVPPASLNALHVSPTSSRPSTSSPPSSAHSDTMKLNTSVDVADSDMDDDETIDVVKSAFVPILRPNPMAEPTVRLADSTTVNDHADVPIRVKCELKAPSSRKPVHETAPRARTPETRLKSTITTHKTVWRPY